MPTKYNALSGQFDLVEDVSSFGDMSGPASSTDNAVARFDGTTGKLLQNSAVTIDDSGVTNGITQLNVDNVRIDGNTVSTTDTNGDLTLSPDGTGGAVVTTNLTVGNSSKNTTFTVNGVSVDATVAVEEENSTDLGGIVCHRHGSAASYGGHFVALRSRGSHAAETVVQDGDTLSLFASAGYDGTDYALAGQIAIQVDGTPGANDMPGRMVFYTSQDGGQTPTEAMRLDSSQNMTLANSLTVANGGTGRASQTAYAVLCGGTTATGAQQSIASVGTSGQVLTSNGAGALPTFQDAAGGGGGKREIVFTAAQFESNESTPAALAFLNGTTVDTMVRAFDDTTVEYVNGKFQVPAEIDTSGTVTFRAYIMAETAAASKNVELEFEHLAINGGEDFDQAYTAENSGDIAIDATQDNVTEATWTETVSNLGWAANDLVFFRLSRTAPSANNLTGDMFLFTLSIEIPRA